MFLEVARQLKGGAPTPQLPSKKPRTSSSSRQRQHQQADFEQQALASPHPESTPVMSTFGNRAGSGAQAANGSTPVSLVSDTTPQDLVVSTKSTVVQLRRNTNKKGRQAPTPPKRTR